MKTKSRLMFMGGMAFATMDISSDWELPKFAIAHNPSWTELNRGKRSKRDRRK